jgi:hypothetical protein
MKYVQNTKNLNGNVEEDKLAVLGLANSSLNRKKAGRVGP